ncbi:MAG: carbohydrate ABC transporter permease [Clostridia bacterium]|nr:carbohydrate ABC transporter permease [Clostridia bacterium]
MEKTVKKKKKFSVYALVIGIALGIYSFVILAILVWGFMASLKMQDEYFYNVMPWLYELGIDFKYISALTYFEVILDGDVPFYVYLDQMFGNSITYSLSCAFISTLSPLVMAYVTNKYRYKISGVLHKIVLIVMVVPIVGTTASTLEIVKFLGIYDTFIGSLILKAGFTNLYFLVFYSAFQTLSWEYAEAAFVDGASHPRVMFGIMIPLIRPIIFSVFLIFFVTYWNDYQTLYTYYPSHPTAALGLFYFNRNTTTSSQEPMLLTGCLLVTIPVIILFLIFREKLMGNLSMGGIKG